MDELKTISGIGQTTAKKLVDAGIADLATLAAADPEKAPEGFSPEDWRKWVEAAAANENNNAGDQQKTPQPNTPSVPDTKPATTAKGPVCRTRIIYRKRYICPGEHLPVDITAEDLAELKALQAID